METQTQTIKYKNKDETIIQFFSESDEHFNSRLELLKKLEEENIDWKEALKLSKIYFNVKFKNCKYTPQVYYMIKKYL
jgi:cell shape-determining protein MreC